MEEKLRYMQNFAGPKNPISVSKMAASLGIERNSLYQQLKKPFRTWDVGRLEAVADLMEWDVIEMIRLGLAYEEKEAIVPKPGKVKQKPGPKPKSL